MVTPILQMREQSSRRPEDLPEAPSGGEGARAPKSDGATVSHGVYRGPLPQ